MAVLAASSADCALGAMVMAGAVSLSTGAASVACVVLPLNTGCSGSDWRGVARATLSACSMPGPTLIGAAGSAGAAGAASVVSDRVSMTGPSGMALTGLLSAVTGLAGAALTATAVAAAVVLLAAVAALAAAAAVSAAL